MSRLCEGRVAIVTGGGRGLGREYALTLARYGAKVLVNDLGADAGGAGADLTPAQQVVEEIRALGGEAAVSSADISDWNGAKQVVEQAVDTFGGLDVLINNAGILRDRMFINMDERDWDDVVRVHLKGTAAPSRHACGYWRARKKEGGSNDARIINTTSHSGIFCNIGQTNYGAAKAAIAHFSITLAREMAGAKYGVTVNAIAPRANTRLTVQADNATEEQLERRRPSWIAALVTWLASPESRTVSGRVFEAWGYGYSVLESWQHGPRMDASEDPTAIGAGVLRIVSEARANAGIDRGSTHNP